jgi:hypothetical protein
MLGGVVKLGNCLWYHRIISVNKTHPQTPCWDRSDLL